LSHRRSPVPSRSVAFGGVLGCLLLLQSGVETPAAAAAPWIRASVTGLGHNAYRITLEVHASEWEGDLPAGADAMSSVSIFGLTGLWPVPTNIVPTGNHRILEIAAGDIVWGADWLAPALESGFDLTIDTASIRVDYQSVVEYFLHTQSSDGRDRFDFLGAQTASGILEAPLPAVGERAWFRAVPTAVTPTTWGRVKERFRSN